MKKIYRAMVESTMTDGEYQMGEINECEYGDMWNGNVRGYIENLDIDGEYTLEDEKALGNIHQTSGFEPIPGSVHVMMMGGEPREIYWAEYPDETPGSIWEIKQGGYTPYALADAAKSFYDGGYRKEDKDELMAHFKDCLDDEQEETDFEITDDIVEQGVDYVLQKLAEIEEEDAEADDE